MDFNVIDTKADAMRGHVYQYRHPQLRHPLFTGPGADSHGRIVDEALGFEGVEPVTALIFGLESPKVRARAKAIQLAAQSGRPIDTNGMKFAASLIGELNGVDNKGKAITASEDDCLWFFSRSEDFALQTLDAAKDGASFFQEPSPKS